MPGAFCDSCAVAKYYHKERGTEDVEADLTMLGLEGLGVYVSRLAALEVQSVFAKKVRSGELARADADKLRNRFLRDVERRHPWSVVALHEHHFYEAERLIESFGDTHNFRTLDALQLAVALDLKKRGKTERFVSADRALCNVAEFVGLKVWNPEG